MEQLDPIPFTPVPSAAARHDGWTPERQRAFIEQLARIGAVTAAARAVGKSPRAAYNLRNRAIRLQGPDSSFVRAWDKAVDRGGQVALDTAIDRGLNGIATPYFYRGKLRGMKVRYDNRLLMSALRTMDRKAHKPARGGTR